MDINISSLEYIAITMRIINDHKIHIPSFTGMVSWLQGATLNHYSDVIMGAMASLIPGVSIVYSTVCSGADQRKHQRSASLAFVRGIHRWPVNSPHKGPVMRTMFPLDDVFIHDKTCCKTHYSTHCCTIYSMPMSSECQTQACRVENIKPLFRLRKRSGDINICYLRIYVT